MLPLELLRQQGGVANTAELLAAGMTQRGLSEAVKNGQLERLRQGLYKSPGNPTDIGVARALGGALSCISALEIHGMWVPHGAHPRHIRVNRRTASTWPTDPIRRRLAPLDIPHLLPSPWRNRVTDPVDTPLRALLTAGLCQPRDELVAALDSALRLGMERSELEQLRPFASATLVKALDLVDSESDSGIESLIRMRLRKLRVRVRSQVNLLGWQCDLVVGEWLVIELDGLDFHRTRESIDKDHWKDRQLTIAGYTVLRFTYTDVMHRWEYCERQIVAAIRADWHIRPRSGAA
ncbi:DUF559 domain-containing protein [Gulosibacter macacae]|uniref:DUF559 domain-containing protein n=1 Tax=Gulosibacter macacae TaxID=2488791 RepID=A0A3P3VXR3_9MICO|nr:type IV toxin-antitoxin system AbiEi family antitoxin domain-containing protein [Gulosibacter macacae]RRJ87575.1 DUF559 domain-containing protein [Gulosibacter macacae]